MDRNSYLPVKWSIKVSFSYQVSRAALRSSQGLGYLRCRAAMNSPPLAGMFGYDVSAEKKWKCGGAAPPHFQQCSPPLPPGGYGPQLLEAAHRPELPEGSPCAFLGWRDPRDRLRTVQELNLQDATGPVLLGRLTPPHRKGGKNVPDKSRGVNSHRKNVPQRLVRPQVLPSRWYIFV